MLIQKKIALALAGIVVSTAVLGAVVACVHSRTPATVGGAILGVILTATSVVYIFRSVADAIAEQRGVAKRLREATARLSTLVDAIPESVYFKDAQGRHLYVNAALAAAAGKTKEEIVGKTAEDLLPPEMAAQCRKSDERVFESRRIAHIEETGTLPSGDPIVTESIKAPIIDDSGSVVGLVGVSRDITARKKAEEEMKKSEARHRLLSEEFRALLDAIPDSLSLQSRDFRFIWTNAVAARSLGSRVEELPGRHCFALWQKRAEPCVPCPVQRCFWTGETEQDVVSRGDGTVWEVRAIPIKDGEGSVNRAVELVRNVTDLHRLEAQLRHSQKMEAVGRLAGGVSHDINNYLGAITGHCENLRLTRSADADVLRKMESIIEISYKASALIRQLLAFSRKQPMHFDPLCLNDVVERMSPMVSRLIGENIAVELSLGEGLWSVRADPDQIEQILMNLLVNAKDAITGRGRVAIRTANVEIGANDPDSRAVMEPGDFVLMSVSDTGIGMPPEVRDKVFEPFFTTKESGRGSGLGLSTVYGIVKQHGGYIWVRSEVAKGSTFEVYLPRCREKPVAGARPSPPGPAVERGDGRILLVEDNGDVRAAIRSLLEAMGYKVAEAPSGEDALALFDGDGIPYDLVITDVVMPGMSGIEFSSRVRELIPEMKFLYISGYTDSVIVPKGGSDRNIHFLQKPFSAHILGRTIQTLLAPREFGP